MAPYYRAESFTSHNSIGSLLCRTFNTVLPRTEALFEDQELTFTQWRVMMSLRDNVATTCADIARTLRHDNGSMTRLVDQLEAQGLVSRSRSNTDRRVVHLALTAKGKKTMEALIPRVVELWNEILVDFTRSEADMLISLLNRLLTKVDAIGEEPQRRAS
jgi:DNA-binding MarR family transcriptional regulator